MKGSTATQVRARLAATSPRSFVASTEVDGPVGAVEAELSRLVRRGEILRVRKGLYWKGPRTRLGVAAPDPEQVALHVAGRGAGPAGISAAHWLGLTTQVPGRPSVAVPGRAPMPVPGVRFYSRAWKRREVGLTPTEVAAIEVLRDWPGTVEVDWTRLQVRLASLTESAQIRPDKIAEAVASEHHPALRERWARVQTGLR
ncbi:MAG: hypothetical protein LH616_10075 [Ilumatobacteraceae bacterium]|nr:hypothetical protein [Ilumatobacteraceae bacterium]